jgi:acyl-CoA dehydrogenase
MPYTAPVSEIKFLLDHVIGLAQVSETTLFEDATADTVLAILTEAGKMCDEVIAPLNRAGDLHPAYLENGVVRTSPGYGAGYRAIAEGGYIAISASPEVGGMGLPMIVASATEPTYDPRPN